MSKSKVYAVSNEEFIILVAESINCSDLMRKLGYNTTTGNSSQIVKRRIEELKLSTSHWQVHNTTNAIKTNEKSIEEYFKQNTSHCGAHTRDKIIKNNLMEYKCAICGNTGEWNGKKLVLQLDHINGDRFDNRLENLRFLCPNCHSQTETFGSKNYKE